MTTVNSGYEARLREVLKKGAPQAPSFAMGLPTVGFLSTSDTTGFLGKIAPYLVYALLITFVILLILVVIHYTVKPIFNFGSNPDALINLTAPDWKKSWDDTSKTYNNDVGGLLLPKNNYSLLFDVNIKNIKPTPEMGNIYIIAYKTAAQIATENTVTGQTLTPPVTGNDGNTYKAVFINDFSFLNTPQAPSDSTKPSLIVAYDAIKGQLTVYFVTKDTSSAYLQSVYSPVTPNKTYRVGVVVSDTNVELYLNGQFVSSKIYPGKTVDGTDTDILVSSPSVYSNNVKIANLFSTNRVVSSGEIRSMGGPATIKLD